MSNFMQDGVTWLAGQLQQHAGRTVTYVRGRGESEPITATPSMRTYEVVEQDGSVNLIEAWDWLFTTAEIVIDGMTIEPRDGDEIHETFNTVATTYQVLPIGKLPCAQWGDASGIMTTVHSKKDS